MTLSFRRIFALAPWSVKLLTKVRAVVFMIAKDRLLNTALEEEGTLICRT